MTITIPVTKVLFVWVISLVLCALCGFTKGEAKGVLVVATLVALIPRPKLKSDQR